MEQEKRRVEQEKERVYFTPEEMEVESAASKAAHIMVDMKLAKPVVTYDEKQSIKRIEIIDKKDKKLLLFEDIELINKAMKEASELLEKSKPRERGMDN
ncbi:MAG: hypothetical protein CEN90_458 [Parcubacteria group bacterium Licking1014_17]|nr:MAG: hypothetical protein CEN90_458 [Parcubacteria group bacterium Licking1014_17]